MMMNNGKRIVDSINLIKLLITHFLIGQKDKNYIKYKILRYICINI